MAVKSLDRLLSQLEEARYSFGGGAGSRMAELLHTITKRQFPDAPSLIRFHEVLTFLRAFPQGPSVLRESESLLNTFHQRVEALRESGADMSPFDPLEVSGISGTQMSDTLSFDVARWLVDRRKRWSGPDETGVSGRPISVEIDWNEWDPARSMASILPRFVPLLEDDALVEADTPWRRWIDAAVGKRNLTPEWLIRQFETLRLSNRERAELYDSLRVPLRWSLGNSRVSRTRNWERPQNIFYHDKPLISRSQVSLADEFARRPPTLVRLSRRAGGRIMDKIREVMLVRYRELYGTTFVDAHSVVRADVDHGVEIHLWNLPPERRLPLRAYTAGLTLKNGVPINYIEAIGLCEWMEVGFNTFYTFRGGEAAWIYAQVLRCLTRLMGTKCISVYPYQLGRDNEEAIESGAFWFYRKLGFRPGRVDLLRLVEQEEQKIAADPKYRTPPRTLRKLAAGHVFYELPGSEAGAWDRFSTRNIGLKVSMRMARDYHGNIQRMREHSTHTLERILRVRTDSWSEPARTAFTNFALVLGEINELNTCTHEEKQQLLALIRSKSSPHEMRYLHLSQQHHRLRKALLRIGTGD